MKTKLFFGLLLLIVSKAYSQIVYTPVTPNHEINISVGGQANLFAIDFNNDGDVDFNFRWDVFSPGVYFMHITSSNTFSYNPDNQVMGTGNSNSFGVPYASPLDYGTAIGSTSSGWITEQRGPLIGDGQAANFLDLGDKYIGVRFLAGGQLYYGWVLVSFTTNLLTIKSYAYQTNPSLGILAGSTGSLSTVDAPSAEKITLYPNPASEYVKVSGFKGNVKYQIHNAEGKMIQQGMTDSKTEINISQLTKGFYIFSVEDKNHPQTMKFIKD